jgi:hypothetical protein
MPGKWLKPVYDVRFSGLLFLAGAHVALRFAGRRL